MGGGGGRTAQGLGNDLTHSAATSKNSELENGSGASLESCRRTPCSGHHVPELI